jgi:hypothetical protein
MICGLLLSSPSYSQFGGLGGLLDDVVNELEDVLIDELGGQSDQADQADQADQPDQPDLRQCFESEAAEREATFYHGRYNFNDPEVIRQYEQDPNTQYRYGAELCEGACDSGDCVNGQGTYTFPDGDQYVGEWRDGEMHGQGTYVQQNRYDQHISSTYVGEWSNGSANGQGTVTYDDGSVFVGEYRAGLRNGQGTMTHPDGRVEAGTWEDGEIVYESPLAEFEATNSGDDLVTWLVLTETCADEFLLSGAVSGSLVEAFEGMISRGIAEERFTSSEVNEAVRQNNLLFAGGLSFEQYELCEALTVMEAGFFPPPDRF